MVISYHDIFIRPHQTMSGYIFDKKLTKRKEDIFSDKCNYIADVFSDK